jgi:alkylation response protein AidB-like acyl-CoA dehydrogenase
VDFDDTPEEAAFRREVRAFLEAHARRKTGTDADWSRGGVSEDPEQAAAYLERCRAWQRTLFDHGWAGITWPKEYGGRGGTPAESIIFNQEASQFDVTTGFIGAAQQLVGPPLLRFGTEEQKARYIPSMLKGDELWCQLFSEPGAGSDLAALATRAVRDGEEWVVTGQKVWTSEAQHADFGILLARTDPDAPKHKGITFFIVDMHSPGIEIRPLVQATGLSHFNEVFLTDVRIPAGNVVGEVNGGWAVARTTLASEAGMIGGAGQTTTFQAVLELARACGRTGDPIVGPQELLHPVALEAGRPGDRAGGRPRDAGQHRCPPGRVLAEAAHGAVLVAHRGRHQRGAPEHDRRAGARPPPGATRRQGRALA